MKAASSCYLKPIYDRTDISSWNIITLCKNFEKCKLSNFLFMDDNARPYRTNLVKVFYECEDIGGLFYQQKFQILTDKELMKH